ncbi:MAG: hypothetical protein CVU39_01770 [Chloroflexi bacterium HGW-Chloroflexi-10]|nr:MAG: hypothetical protein CVU39_01770 [Chloroflexi bacterium HGW-Chloroflexi-10]
MDKRTIQTKDKTWINDIILRHLLQKDLPDLEWEGEYIHLRNVYRNAFEKAKEGKNILWVADLPGTGIIGQLFLQFNSARSDLADGYHRAYLYAFRIRPPYRNAGLGYKMLHTVELDLMNRSFWEISLNVARTNEAAIRFYQKYGFVIDGPESGEWSFRDHNNQLRQVSEPAWRMLKKIDN